LEKTALRLNLHVAKCFDNCTIVHFATKARAIASWHRFPSQVILSGVKRSGTQSKNPVESPATGFFDSAALRSE